MKEYFLDVAKDVESGKYFEEGKIWYQEKYIYPVIDRTFLLMLTIVAIGSSVVALWVLSLFLPIVQTIPIAIGVDDMSKSYSRISAMKVRNLDEDPDYTVMYYLIGKYVKSYESYDYLNDFEELKKNKNYIKQFSSDDVIKQYEYNISISNPDGLTIRYETSILRNIEAINHKIKITTNGAGEIMEVGGRKINRNKYIAIIPFFSYESNVDGYTKWEAEISFEFDSLKYYRETKEFSQLRLNVTDYQSVEIK